MVVLITKAVSLFLVAMVSGEAIAQDKGVPRRDPSAEDIHTHQILSSGFVLDPPYIAVLAGGEVEASVVGEGCLGRVSIRPLVRLTFEAGAVPLVVRTRSEYEDTTLVVHGPDGRWYRKDELGADGSETIRWDNPQSGSYEIWVGLYGDGYQRAKVFISEERS
jgi:hypothetical protein